MITDKLNRFTSGALVDAMAERNSTATKAEHNTAMNRTFDAIAAMLAAGDQVRIAGFGTFKKTHRAERQATNPRTREKVTVAAHDVVTFKASKKPA